MSAEQLLIMMQIAQLAAKLAPEIADAITKVLAIYHDPMVSPEGKLRALENFKKGFEDMVIKP